MLRKITAIFAMFSLILGSNAWGHNEQEQSAQGTETTQALEAEAIQQSAAPTAPDEALLVEAPAEAQAPLELGATAKPVTQENQAAKTDLEVLEFVLASKIENREPQITEGFASADDRAYAFARLNVKNPGKVTFVWYRNDSEYTRFTTDIQAAKKWRTYASVKLRPGTWKVQLLNEDNSLLAEKTFTLQ